MLSILKNLSPSSIIKSLLVLALFAMLVNIMSLKSANASLSLDNKALAANTLVLKTTNAENTETIGHLKYQLQQHEQIVYERSLIVTDIAASNVDVKRVLVETIKESNDETITAWADELVPIDIKRLLNSTGHSSADQGGKSNTTQTTDQRLSRAGVYWLNKSRSG